MVLGTGRGESAGDAEDDELALLAELVQVDLLVRGPFQKLDVGDGITNLEIIFGS